MELKEFINKAFEKYEESPKLIDFKEELLTNLQDRLKSLETTGLTREEDLKEIESEYMSLRHFVTNPLAVIYTILGVLIGFGLITSGLSYLSSGKIESLTGVLMLFLVVPLAGFVYMGLTQETATRHPMRPLRASIYSIAVLVLLFGISLIPIMIFSTSKPLVNVLAILIPFVLPTIGVIGFLMITEMDYRKAWVLKEAEKHHAWSKKFETSGNAQTFGIMSAGV